MDELNNLTEQHILNIQRAGGDNTEVAWLQQILNAITKLRAKLYKKDQTDDVVKEYSRLKGIFISTLNEAHSQTAGLQLLSDQEGLNRAYNNNHNISYDGNETYIYIAGSTYTKDLFINDLTIPLRLIRYTDRYKQAHQLFTDKK